MKILAFDAAIDGFSAALDLDGDVRASGGGRPDALERGLERIAELLAGASLRITDLDRIAVGIGPGSFTGVRIAVAYAKSLAYGSGVPLVGISSYDALEPAGAPLPSLTVVAGRRGVICARLRDDCGSRVACGPTANVLERLLGATAGSLSVSGNTEDVLAATAERGLIVRALPLRASLPAVAIAQLARTREPSPTPHALAPDYGESPAVTVPRDARS